MSNQYFQFKQFRIDQGACAMKVTTDACIQGAWTPINDLVKTVLDIGAGTGLLSLMLAQRNPGIIIDAIELDSDAAGQARENTTNSPWKDRIKVIEADVRDFVLSRKYDLIITNPPFFTNSLLSNRQTRNIARHTLQLSFHDLLNVIDHNLSDEGYVSVLLPYSEYEIWRKLSEQAGLIETRRLLVRHSQNATVNRVVGIFAKKEKAITLDEALVIYDSSGNYTPQFTDLLSPFYLNL